MELTTDRASPLPLGTQLAEQIRNAIHTGELERGEALPTIRDLAKRAGVNVMLMVSFHTRSARPLSGRAQLPHSTM